METENLVKILEGKDDDIDWYDNTLYLDPKTGDLIFHSHDPSSNGDLVEECIVKNIDWNLFCNRLEDLLFNCPYESCLSREVVARKEAKLVYPDNITNDHIFYGIHWYKTRGEGLWLSITYWFYTGQYKDAHIVGYKDKGEMLEMINKIQNTYIGG